MRITIILEDLADDNVMVQTMSDPSIDEWTEEGLTGAQMMALGFLDTLSESMVEDGDIQ